MLEWSSVRVGVCGWVGSCGGGVEVVDWSIGKGMVWSMGRGWFTGGGVGFGGFQVGSVGVVMWCFLGTCFLVCVFLLECLCGM